MQKKRCAASVLIANCIKFICVSLCMFLLVGCCEDALEIHEKILTIDTHVDTPLFIYYEDLDLGEYHNPHEVNRKVDFPRMEEGGLDAIFFAFWVAQGPRTPEGNEDASGSDCMSCLEENRSMISPSLS